MSFIEFKDFKHICFVSLSISVPFCCYLLGLSWFDVWTYGTHNSHEKQKTISILQFEKEQN